MLSGDGPAGEPTGRPAGRNARERDGDRAGGRRKGATGGLVVSNAIFIEPPAMLTTESNGLNAHLVRAGR